MDANGLRRAFTGFFEKRGHTVLPSASLVPTDPDLLFTIAGMVPFKPAFLGEEAPPAKRATTIQKCLRAGGKHNDLEAIGTTSRHLTFFEMLGNFSFGDYFKELAIPFAWECSTQALGFDPERIWVTVHHSDDEAEAIWLDGVGVRPERLQRMGEDNWWQMGSTGPCGPCSELYYDRGPAYGSEGGPAHGGPERYVEFWNLVFMQFNQATDGALSDLPMRNIDTGGGFERMLALLGGMDSVFDTPVLRPMLETAESITGRRYGVDHHQDVALRIMADHARAMTFLVGDGVFPSNEGRGYVLRRIIRRSVLRASNLSRAEGVTPRLAQAVVELMSEAYPALSEHAGTIAEVLSREEELFRKTLRAGSALLDQALAGGSRRLSGEVAFRLHDTFGFPLDLTKEIAQERGVEIDMAGFEAAMAMQRQGSRLASAQAKPAQGSDAYKDILARCGTTRFVGYDTQQCQATVVATMPASAGEGGPPGDYLEVFLDSTPFYAEGGGQVGDTGWLRSGELEAEVLDTTAPLAGLHRHRVRLHRGTLAEGDGVTATVDGARRLAVMRNHTGTHLLHWALREVLGSHLRQQGSLVAPDRLRFDFSHHAAPSPEELRRAEDLVNAQILSDAAVQTEVSTKAEAEAKGAIAFFGDRYGERVRVVSAGPASVELCGGTHVAALGMIGPLRIIQESSIGSNTRRVEAVTGEASLKRSRWESELLERAAKLLQSSPSELVERVEELREEQRRQRDQLKALQSQARSQEAAALVASALNGRVVARLDGKSNAELRDLAVAVRDDPGIEAVALLGSPDGSGVAMVVAVKESSSLVASEVIGPAARAVGGGGGRGGDLVMAGGRDVSRLGEAVGIVERLLGLTEQQ